MCMIAHRYLGPKGKGANIPNAVIDAALTRHPDGWGVAWRDPEEGLLYQKFGPTEKVGFRNLLKALDADKTIEYVAHWRFATHGPEDEAHAHPYSYEDHDPKVGTVLVFHNGIISGVTTTKLESDTEVFVRDYLARLPSRWWDNAGIRRLVDHMGGWSRLVLMTNEETINLNHYAGEDDGGLWYSSDHRPSGYTVSRSRGATGVYSSTYSSLMGTDWDDDEEWYRDEKGDWVHNWDSKYASTKPTVTPDPETTTPKSNSDMFMHQGHELSPLQTFDFSKDGEYEFSVICETCGTQGDVYVIDGRAYIDIPHAWTAREDSERTITVPLEQDENDILPGEDAVSRALTVVVGASGQNYARVN